MPEQLHLNLPVRPAALGRADFFVSPSNALAVALIDQPGTWVGGRLALYGPAGAGKTHLAHVWAEAAGARICAAVDLAGADIPDLARTDIAVEDVPAIAANASAQTALFHLHNLIQAEGRHLLMTGRPAPDQWGLSLPDLQSRVSGMQAIALAPPDDALLIAILAKLFADRQIVPRADVIPYLVGHMDRTFAAAEQVVAALDRAALRDRRDVTRQLAIRVLTDLQR